MSDSKTSTAESHDAEEERARAWDGWEEAKAAGRDALNRLDRLLSLDGYEGGSIGRHE
jgi:hypothetical protein